MGRLGVQCFLNVLAAFISDPVDVATGTYTINTTDFILAGLLGALKLERTYGSTSGKSQVDMDVVAREKLPGIVMEQLQEN